MKKLKYLRYLGILILCIYISACSSSRTDDDQPENTTENNPTENTTYDEAAGGAIISIAQQEQQNEMYSPAVVSTYLYWLDNRLISLNNATKCNIFALNVLYKAGFKTPKVNALTRDLFDTSKFEDVFPVVGVSDPEAASKGDLIVFNGHVIIFESLVKIKKDMYALAWWAGTHQADNGDNVLNNVCYGKYKLSGYYVIRRPIKN
jgi:hypothetical protein